MKPKPKSRQPLRARKVLAKYSDAQVERAHNTGFERGVDAALAYRQHLDAMRRGRPMVLEDLEQQTQLQRITSALEARGIEFTVKRAPPSLLSRIKGWWGRVYSSLSPRSFDSRSN